MLCRRTEAVPSTSDPLAHSRPSSNRAPTLQANRLICVQMQTRLPCELVDDLFVVRSHSQPQANFQPKGFTKDPRPVGWNALFQ